jgi:hypothetical protein
VIDRFSHDLHAAYPEMKGFSPRNYGAPRNSDHDAAAAVVQALLALLRSEATRRRMSSP